MHCLLFPNQKLKWFQKIAFLRSTYYMDIVQGMLTGFVNKEKILGLRET